MKQTILLASVAALAAAGIVYALLALAREARRVAEGFDTLTAQVNQVAGDVNSIADDVNAIANVLAGEPDADEATFRRAIYKEGRAPHRPRLQRLERQWSRIARRRPSTTQQLHAQRVVARQEVLRR